MASKLAASNLTSSMPCKGWLMYQACERCCLARSWLFVLVWRMLPSWRWVLATITGGGEKLNTAVKHLINKVESDHKDVTN